MNKIPDDIGHIIIRKLVKLYKFEIRIDPTTGRDFWILVDMKRTSPLFNRLISAYIKDNVRCVTSTFSACSFRRLINDFV